MHIFCLRKWYVLWLAMFMLPCLQLSAQQPYSLSDLVQSAQKYFPLLKQRASLTAAGKAAVTDVRHSFLPQVRVSDQVNLSTDNSLAGTYLPLGLTISSSAGVRADNVSQAATGNFGVLYGEYDLVDFGLRSARLDNAQAYVNLLESDTRQQDYLLQLEVARNYFDYLKAAYTMGADAQNVNRYDSIFRVIRVLAASGIKPGADSSQARAELARATIVYNQSAGNLERIKVQLAYLTGIPGSTLAIDTATRPAIGQLPVLLYSPDTSGNPLLEYYRRRNDVFLSAGKLIRKSYNPKILLAGGSWIRGSSIQYNDVYKPLTTGLGYQRFNYAAGVAITYSLFNPLTRKDKLAVNRLQAEAADFELQQQQLALTQAGDQALSVLHTIEANLQQLPLQLESAQDTYQQKLAQYKAGINSLVDLTNASFVLYRSQTDYIQAVNDWYLAQLDRASATGHLQNFIQTIK
jgi:outer membrane protein TolC